MSRTLLIFFNKQLTTLTVKKIAQLKMGQYEGMCVGMKVLTPRLTTMIT